jgi:TolA-binding protein
MIKKTILLTALVVCSHAQEVSVFGAGNLDSAKPYGLTSSEKYILKNKQKLGSIDSKVKGVNSSIEMLTERIDGIESVYESDSRRLNKALKEVNKIVEEKEAQDAKIEDMKSVLNQLMQLQEENNARTSKNIAILKSSIKKLTKLVNKINSNYISVKEFEATMKQFSNGSAKVTTKNKTKSKSSKIDSKKSSAQLMKEAKAYFNKQYYKNAIPIFEALLQKNYKPAESNFYLGEIWYNRKKYSDAINYFKKSAVLYDKASWMPKLLLHSAISFEKLGDVDNASSFYSTLIDVYGDTKEAKIAKKKL